MGKNLDLQLWCARKKKEKFDIFKIEPVRKSVRKPMGGLWTSTFTPDREYCSDWIEWCCSEMPEWVSGECYLIKPSNDVKVYEINSKEDFENLYMKYPRNIKIGDYIHRGIDWEKVCKDYDAVHLTERGLSEIGTSLYGFELWDVESTFWCRPKFSEIKHISEVKDRKCKVICD